MAWQKHSKTISLQKHTYTHTHTHIHTAPICSEQSGLPPSYLSARAVFPVMMTGGVCGGGGERGDFGCEVERDKQKQSHNSHSSSSNSGNSSSSSNMILSQPSTAETRRCWSRQSQWKINNKNFPAVESVSLSLTRTYTYSRQSRCKQTAVHKHQASVPSINTRAVVVMPSQ